MYHPIRGLCAVLLTVAFTVSGSTLSAHAAQGTSSAVRPPGHGRGEFTHGEALSVLARAESRLRPSSRLRARKPVGHGPSTELTMTLRDLFLARTALRGSERRRADAILSRPRTASSGASDPNTEPLSTPAISCTTNFCVHYQPAPPTGSTAGTTTAAQVHTTLSTLEHVRAYETQTLGYRAPVSDAPGVPSADNPDGRFDVFLGDIGRQGLYGYCAPDEDQPDATGRAAAYCVLDNDYAYAQYGSAPFNSLRVTAAHEFFHTIQFAYDVSEDIWFMEGTATWVEDEVYDTLNDNYQYLADSPIRQPRRPIDYSVGLHLYGSFLFFKYASERLHDRRVVRQFWEYADAPRNRYSLQAVRAVLAARRVSWPAFYSVFGSWNSLPGLTYSEGTRYPAPALAFSKTLSKRNKRASTTGWRSVSLPHLSNAAVRAVPAAHLSPRKNLLVEVNTPPSARGGTALVQRRYRNGTVINSMLTLNGAGNGRLLVRFDHRSLASVAVVLSNTSSSMRDCGRIGDGFGGPLYSCYGRGYYDRGQSFAVRETVR